MNYFSKSLRSLFYSLGLMVAGNAVAIEYHGYFRSGIGAGQWGTDQGAFEVPGAGAKFRLGNETDTYIETGFSQDHGKASESEPFFRSHLKFSFKSNGHRDWEPSNVDFDEKGAKKADAPTTLALREVYAEGKNVCAAGTNLWVGKRFYMREDLHLLDYYLLDNAGPGAGLEGISLGDLKLNVAVTRNVPAPEAKDLPAQTNIDLRLSGIEFMKGSSLMPVLIYGASGERGATNTARWEPLNGFHSALIYRQDLAAELNNQFSIQYGTGIFGAKAAWGGSTLNQWGAWESGGIVDGEEAAQKARKKSSTLRLSDQVTLGKTDSLSGQFVVVYESIDFGGGETLVNKVATKVPKKTTLMAGIRPQYHFGPSTLLALEIGHTAVTKQLIGDADAGTQHFADLNMTKYTIAPTAVPDLGFWSRPQLRFFASYAKWNNEVMNTSVYDDKAGWSLGSQVEAWW